MSKLSIYKTSWIDLVFEYRNKEYGAYQLRQESTKTTLMAFSMGLLLVATIGTIPLIVNRFSPNTIQTATIPDITDTIIHIVDIIPNQLKKIEKPVLPEPKTQSAEPITQKQLVNPIITQAAVADQDIPKNTEIKSTTVAITDGTATAGATSTGSSGTGTEGTKEFIPGNAVVTSAALDNLPEFPGGIKKFYSYVGNNFEKPEIEGERIIRVNVSFVIEKDGSMTDIEVMKDPGYGLGKEAIRVLKSLKTKWKPGMIAGKPMRTAYNLPISVEMN
jgi:outer membrane biosynthesis protein TonB